MRQTIIALLLALTLALGLSGCTNKTQNGTGNSSTGNTQSGTSDSGTGSSENRNRNGGNSYGANDNNGTNYNNGTNNGGTNNGSVGSDLKRETEDLLRGRSYDEMLRNGHVNDTDGFLTDGENHVSR